MQQYTILLFGPASALIGADRVVVQCPSACTCDELKVQIVNANPTLETHLQVGRLAVNQGFVAGDASIDPHAEIALITMVSGG